MLEIPEIGFARSIGEHNVDLDIFCDWVQASLLFQGEDEVSASDVIDSLIDGQIYDNQGFAWEFVDQAWRELKRRAAWMGVGSPIQVEPGRLKRVLEWKQSAAHSFCLLVSCGRCYPEWARSFGHDYTVQGALFEELTKESLRRLFVDWEIHSTGWTKSSARKLDKVVAEVAAKLGEPVGSIERWTDASANEAGLDIVFYRSFADGRVGLPVYLMQCASGANWNSKLHTPNLKIWGRIVQFTAVPRKAFAIPYSLTDGEFIKACNLVDGVLLDRYRLLSPGRTVPDWTPTNLVRQLIKWIEPRAGKLPTDDMRAV